MADDLFKTWLDEVMTKKHPGDAVRVFREKPTVRTIILPRLVKAIADHFVGADNIAKLGGYEKAAFAIRNSIPTSKRIRSGDFGELVAMEYVDAVTRFKVPIRKLRWKSDRKMPMHGNDVVAVDQSKKPVNVLKCESKSGGVISAAVVTQALAQLDEDGGRPNPSTLCFIMKRLLEANRDEDAKLFQHFQCEGAPTSKQLTHAVIVCAGKNPATTLGKAATFNGQGIRRELAAVVIDDHADLIHAVFEKAHGGKP